MLLQRHLHRAQFAAKGIQHETGMAMVWRLNLSSPPPPPINRIDIVTNFFDELKRRAAR